MELQSPSRRKFLRRTVIGGVALGGARVVPALPFLEKSRLISGAVPTFLSPRQFRTLQAVCNRMIPKGDAMPSASDVGVARHVDLFLSRLDRPVAEQIALLLDVFEFSPPLFDLKWGRLTSFDEPTQDEILASWENSRLDFRRTGFLALKRLSLAAYYSQDATWKAIGYDGPVI